MRTYLRVTWRLICLLTVFFASAFAALAITPLRWIAPAFRLRLRNRILKAWGRNFCKTLGIDLNVTGSPPQGEFILVSNHVSYVDIPLLTACVDAAFVAKTELAGWPLMGKAFQIGDTIFIDRTRKRDLIQVMQRVEKCLANGLGVIIFPEGTSGRGDKILPLKASLLQLAVRDQQPVHYATLCYRTYEGSPQTDEVVCWWGDTLFVPHILHLLTVPGFRATVHFGESPVFASDRKQLANDLHQAMQQHFEPMVLLDDESDASRAAS